VSKHHQISIATPLHPSPPRGFAARLPICTRSMITASTRSRSAGVEAGPGRTAARAQRDPCRRHKGQGTLVSPVRIACYKSKAPSDRLASLQGSTCAMVESILRAAGYRTGLFTSPHLCDVRERIRLDGYETSASASRNHCILPSTLSLPDRLTSTCHMGAQAVDQQAALHGALLVGVQPTQESS